MLPRITKKQKNCPAEDSHAILRPQLQPQEETMSEQEKTPPEQETTTPKEEKSIEEICAEIDKEASELLDWLATW